MRIRQISVTGLFGIFDHVIPLNTDERITIIHGPNGFGKTMILRMLNGLFNSDYSVFWNIPFNSFKVELNNDICVEIAKKKNQLVDSKKNNITCHFYQKGIKMDSFQLKRKQTSNTFVFTPPAIYTLKLQGLASQLEKIDTSISSLKEVEDLSKECECLQEIFNNIHVRLIESQRLLNPVSKSISKPSIEARSMLPTVSAYSDDLAERIQAKLAEYGTVSQSLDRTFPKRIVQQPSYPALTKDQLRHKLDELESNRSRLIEVGLLDKDENSDFQVQPQDIIDESTKNILSVYVEDTEKKLSVFDDISSKLYLLGRIINKKFAYSYKKINFSDNGFVFTSLYPTSFNHAETISPTDLSSGEQHELVLLYELLFKVQPDSLVLIDEPELSLHVGWQVQFLQDLQDITELADLDILMATHSPAIIDDRWDLTVELKGPTQ